MAECLQHANDFTDGNGQDFAVFYDDYIDLETCPINATHFIIVDGAEYSLLVQQAELLANSQGDTFDTEAYDFAYEGVLMSWVIGLSVGLILAMVARLKR